MPVFIVVLSLFLIAFVVYLLWLKVDKFRDLFGIYGWLFICSLFSAFMLLLLEDRAYDANTNDGYYSTLVYLSVIFYISGLLSDYYYHKKVGLPDSKPDRGAVYFDKINSLGLKLSSLTMCFSLLGLYFDESSYEQISLIALGFSLSAFIYVTKSARLVF